MITIRKSSERGHFNHGWLDTYHTFSFASYHDPRHVHFGALRVLNEDRVAPDQGFGEHGHADMEIVTYVLSGELSHRDSMGNVASIRAGELQRMTAGTGVTHSEFNNSHTTPVHLVQIWIFPDRKGLLPGYEQRLFPQHEFAGQLRLVASRDARADSLTIHQNVDIYLCRLQPDQSATHPLPADRQAWVQVLRGDLNLNRQKLSAGDGAAVTGESQLTFAADAAAEFLLFDLA